jgi:rhomboid protease GluP
MAEKRHLPIVTILFAVANIAVFIWELAAGADPLQPTAQWMVDHGGNFGPLTLHGESWRLVTSMFLHYGLLHIAMNMIGLVDGGRHVEKMYGAAGFAALYLVSGLAGGLATGMRSNVASAGASGAIFGVFGAFGAFLLLHRTRLDVEQVKKQARGLLVFLAYNLYFGLTAKGIDLVAHLGGLAAGFLVGLALEVGTDHGPSTVRRALLVGVLGTALVFGLTFVVPAPTNAIADFSKVEETVLARWNGLVPQLKANTVTGVQSADIIEAEILPPWRTARAAFARDADGPLRDDMLEYLAARQEGWEQMAKALRDDDAAGVAAGMTRFSQGDAVIERIKRKRP